jgi:hypothetical protein
MQKQARKITIQIFSDGENQQTEGLEEIIKGWSSEWNQQYSEYGAVNFETGPNLKEKHDQGIIPNKLKNIAFIRNPDLFFVVKDSQKVLGGIEITVHSPDGSNVEKRYPYLWAVMPPLVKTRF